ncbi:hypothetical protein GCM10011508_13260 [Flavobacterium lutivivi]|nr:hypothetical protein GCM10011508_13260 [Flavobacterium lutivivi]
MKNLILSFVLLYTFQISYSQSDFEKTLQAGAILINGLSFIKGNKPKPDSKTIEYLCVKNKLTDKVTFKLTCKTEDGDEIKKELVIQNDGKECVYEIPKGVWSYEIILANKETYKKGEFKLDDDITITVKDD